MPAVDHVPTGREGRHRTGWSLVLLVVAIAAQVLLVIVGLLVVGLLAYFSMFECTGSVFESGCDYRGAPAGVGFVVTMTIVGTLGVRLIVGLVTVNTLRGPVAWGIAAFVALTASAGLLFVGHPWPREDATPYVTTEATTTQVPAPPAGP